jgi:hypothetical protein
MLKIKKPSLTDGFFISKLKAYLVFGAGTGFADALAPLQQPAVEA